LPSAHHILGRTAMKKYLLIWETTKKETQNRMNTAAKKGFHLCKFQVDSEGFYVIMEREVPDKPSTKRNLTQEALDRHLPREFPEPPAPQGATAIHMAYGSLCYVCHKNVGADWDDHFRRKHPDRILPSEQFQQEIDAGIHQ